ncbi:potassium channel subfamily K member 15-like isoform X1 [Pectinophora gossypiella]|uniref:potassium channel subfamily K member 15-like isoform X1 n=1 Tax=Pectinophora gossypiella TaxID=13191 RepID=UPI00214ED6D0|nr:potassium channel subfamily K member 15-like isoform X1 [Pectinophora gossypiella]
MPRRKRRVASRLRACLRQLGAFLFSNVGVVVLVVGYTIAGAFMFQAIEGASEMERVNNMARERDNTVQYLWQNVTLLFNPLNETAMKDRISKELHVYQSKIVFAVRHGWDGGRSSRQWSFSSAFLYSLTVITTIGYGHLSPRTSWGKISTIFYALLGMPLFLLYLTNVGELLARWFKCIYALVCLCRGCPGFSRRRIARLRTQLDISEAESIERPEHWRERHDWDTFCRHPDLRHMDYYPEFYAPGRFPSRPRFPTERIPLERIPERAERIPDFESAGTPPHRYFQRRTDYTRSASMPQPYARAPPRAPRGWSEPARMDQESSEFSYVTFDAQTITVPISVCVAIMVGYLIFGSMIFGLWEKWDQLDGAYFCFISLSSIGFGDFVPGERIYTPRIETSFIVCSMYLMLGMALVAMCFNLMQEQVIHYAAGLKRAVKRICRCKR